MEAGPIKYEEEAPADAKTSSDPTSYEDSGGGTRTPDTRIMISDQGSDSTGRSRTNPNRDKQLQRDKDNAANDQSR
jgi:hypothetical protein